MTTFLDMEVSELPSTHKLCYLGDCNFTRSSVAYDYKGDEVAVNQPRFTHRVPDTTVTNLLTGNQSDGGDTNNPELLTLNQRTGTDALGDTTGFDPKFLWLAWWKPLDAHVVVLINGRVWDATWLMDGKADYWDYPLPQYLEDANADFTIITP